MRLSLKSAGRLDWVTGALISGGLALIGISLLAARSLVTPVTVVQPGAAADLGLASPMPVASTASAALSADQVATVLFVDATTGAGSAARTGDRVDVLGYFSRQAIGSESVTRTLLPDVPVLMADHAGPNVALTLAVSHDGALLLQEALAIGARPFVTLRSTRLAANPEGVPPSFSDTDLATRLAGLG